MRAGPICGMTRGNEFWTRNRGDGVVLPVLLLDTGSAMVATSVVGRHGMGSGIHLVAVRSI